MITTTSKRNAGTTLPLLTALCWITATAVVADHGRTRDHDYDAPVPGSYTLPVVKMAADGEVLDSRGRPLRLSELTRGRVTVMSFIYTRCAAPMACPMATGVLRELHRFSAEDAALAEGMRLVSMSFDPGNDTPGRMAAYSALAQTAESRPPTGASSPPRRRTNCSRSLPPTARPWTVNRIPTTRPAR
jgi:cytochrome oxidase Cu insertion factor (SCO1/SenC/PrrC family)